MRHGTHAQTLKLAGWLAAFVLPLLISSETPGQSGRRTQKASPSPGVADQSNPKRASQSSSSPELARDLVLLACRQPTSKRFVAEDAIFASFVNRLNEYSSIKANAIGDLKRSKATKRARAETDAIVVVLQFTVDSFQEGTILLNSHDLIVEYAAFEPRTAKQIAKGKVYYQQVGGGRLRKSGWPTGPPIKITTEATGVEAAEQLYALLVLKVGVKR
jgi:hypothetical protein